MYNVANRPASEFGAPARSNIVYTPRFDICEHDNEFVLSGDLPGVTPADVELRFEDGELKIWGKVAPRHEDVRHWAEEYGVGDYYRIFTLGEMVDGESISAELKDGVLTVHLPKKFEARLRRIEVKAE